MIGPGASVNRFWIKKAIAALCLLGGYIGLAALVLFQLYLKESYEIANTVALTTIVVTAQVLAMNFRSLDTPIFSAGWFSNPWFLIAVIAMLGLQVAAVYAPPLQEILHTTSLKARDWAVIIIVSLPLFIIPEANKIIKRKRVRNNQKGASL